MRLLRTFWPEAAIALVGLLLLATVVLGRADGNWHWREGSDGNTYLYRDELQKGVWVRREGHYRWYNPDAGLVWGEPQDAPPRCAPPFMLTAPKKP